MESARSALDICKDKFREGEHVVSVFEAYVLVDAQHKSRLLALVHSNNAYALFSFAVATTPPLSFVDLTVDTIFAIDGNFHIVPLSSGFSDTKFKVETNRESVMFYFYAYSTFCDYSFQHFLADIKAAEIQYGEYADGGLDYSWLNPYKRVDQSAIDRNIADGHMALKKRESKFQDELEKREHEYTVYRPLNIYIATWNVNGQPPNNIALNEWLNTTEDPPDIYAIAFQELDLSAKAFTVSETRPDPVWTQRVLEGLHPNGDYEELVSVRLVGMMLIVVIRGAIRSLVNSFSTAMVGTGALNMMGNKGAVGVSLHINESRVCFVNSHLAAHVYEVVRRKEDHDEILRRMQFECGIRRLNILEHDHVFWFGDLNYRIIESSKVDVLAFRRQFNRDNIYEDIKRLDQLYVERKRNEVFVGFEEGAIAFRPTYKYDPGTDNWDSSEKCRAPAWCDRVLWRSKRTTQASYHSTMQLRLSDHKPVYSHFVTHIKSRDEARYNQVYEEVLRTVDKYENDNQPQITVPDKDIDFGEIRFGERIVRDIRIANNCHLPATFRFVGREGQHSPLCESWLNIEPKTGRLITGDCVSVTLELYADARSLWKLHRKQRYSGQKVPLDILVLHVDNGHDIFITIIGEYRPTCVGFNMDTLCMLREPIVKMNLKDILRVEEGVEQLDPPQTAVIPRELWLMADYLLSDNRLATPNLFNLERRYSCNPNIIEIRDWLDSWSTTDFPGTPNTAAEMLLMLLEGSPESLVHPYEDMVVTVDRYEECKALVKTLPAARQKVLVYVCLFLHEVLKHHSSNRLSTYTLAKIFSAALLKSRTVGQLDRRCEVDQDERRTKFLSRLIDNDMFVRDFARIDLPVVNRSMPLIDLS